MQTWDLAATRHVQCKVMIHLLPCQNHRHWKNICSFFSWPNNEWVSDMNEAWSYQHVPTGTEYHMQLYGKVTDAIMKKTNLYISDLLSETWKEIQCPLWEHVCQLVTMQKLFPCFLDTDTVCWRNKRARQQCWHEVIMLMFAHFWLQRLWICYSLRWHLSTSNTA